MRKHDTLIINKLLFRGSLRTIFRKIDILHYLWSNFEVLNSALGRQLGKLSGRLVLHFVAY